MNAQPKVLGPAELDNGGILGETIQVALVTDDMAAALAELTGLGIGPWRIFDIGPHNSSLHCRGEQTGFSMRLAFANHGAMAWELIEPTGGHSIYQEFLDGGHSGFHHVAVEGSDAPFPERVAALEGRGFEEVQGGTAFDGAASLGYFHNGAAHSPWIEIFDFPPGFELRPDEWYPEPPQTE
jgi:4-hydroxyphenylpyruvate dioxygenase-like putative hemolysin